MLKPNRFFILIVAGLVFALALFYFPGQKSLELRVVPVKGGPALLVLPLEFNERFTIYYLHSVENAPIWETHSVDESGRIFIEEERYLKFGAGMGRMPGVGRMVRRNGFEVIEDMHMPTGDFILRIGSPGVDHTVIWRSSRVNLSALAPHVAVLFSAQPVSRWYDLMRRLRPHPATPIDTAGKQ